MLVARPAEPTPSSAGPYTGPVPVRFTTFATPLGPTLVATSEVGVVALRLGDDVATLVADLCSRFPAGSCRRDDTGLAGVAQVVLDELGGEVTDPPVPLDLRGTPFQLEVWEALRTIPRGETRTYTEVAAAVSRPRAVRAVGRACGANPVALLVPCHRVVATGGLGGYAGGLERKQALLELEGADWSRSGDG